MQRVAIRQNASSSAIWQSLPVTPRAEPPVIGDAQHAVNASLPVRLGSVNVAQTSLDETVDGAQFKATKLSDALGQATFVRIIEGYSSEAAKGLGSRD